ncbi:hypothetical protein J4411_03320 [Candidatus Pacearchaeota archaeon]|nr:hypothetical protein [Candidatus Pacearchaeota archaeon]
MKEKIEIKNDWIFYGKSYYEKGERNFWNCKGGKTIREDEYNPLAEKLK